jgi:hypothetical protein
VDVISFLLSISEWHKGELHIAFKTFPEFCKWDNYEMYNILLTPSVVDDGGIH